LIQVLPRTIPVDLAALFIDRILNRRLVVTRTPGATEYSPRVQTPGSGIATGISRRAVGRSKNARAAIWPLGETFLR